MRRRILEWVLGSRGGAILVQGLSLPGTLQEFYSPARTASTSAWSASFSMKEFLRAPGALVFVSVTQGASPDCLSLIAKALFFLGVTGLTTEERVVGRLTLPGHSQMRHTCSLSIKEA